MKSLKEDAKTAKGTFTPYLSELPQKDPNFQLVSVLLNIIQTVIDNNSDIIKVKEKSSIPELKSVSPSPEDDLNGKDGD